MSIYYILKELSKSKDAEIYMNVGKILNKDTFSDQTIIDLVWSHDNIYGLLQNGIRNHGWILNSHKKEQVYSVHNLTYYLTNECSATLTEEFVDWSLIWKSNNTLVLGAYPVHKRQIAKSNIKITDNMSMHFQEKWGICCNKSVDLNIIKINPSEYHIKLMIQSKHEILDLANVVVQLNNNLNLNLNLAGET